MAKVSIVGAGRIGSSIVKLLSHQADFEIVVADSDKERLRCFEADPKISTQALDATDTKQLADCLQGQDAVISACSFDFNIKVAKAALRTGCSYFDLTEDVKTTKAIRDIAEQAKPAQVFMPQCGLAPGFIGILGNNMGTKFDKLLTLKLRVGALPEFPSNPMMYNLTWSTDGLINEYCNICEAIRNGQRVELVPLEGLENFSLDGTEYEAFNTSGGLGTLCESLQDQVKDLTYKTIRYKGHQHLMDFLINGLRLGEAGERRQLLKKIFESAVAVTRQDVVLIFVTATGINEGQLIQITDSRKIYHRELYEEHWSAIQITTAAGLCAALDIVLSHPGDYQGFVRQEAIDYETFINNRFGHYYQVTRDRE